MINTSNDKAEETNSDLMKTRGHSRYQERAEKQGSLASQSNNYNLITQAHPRVSSAIEESIRAAQSHGPGRRPLWLVDLSPLDPDLLAYIGLNACMTAVAQEHSMALALTEIGQRVELEHWQQGLNDYDPGLHGWIERKVTADHQSGHYRVKAARIIASKAGYTADAWEADRRAKVASAIYNAVIDHSDIFEVWHRLNTARGKIAGKTRMLGLVPGVAELLAQQDLEASWREPMLMPMLTPPEPWTSTTQGGYFDPKLSALTPLVRSGTHTANNQIDHQIETDGIPPYIEALNAIQATPLQLSDYVLEAIKWAWETEQDVGKFPTQRQIAIAEYPENYEMLEPSVKKGLHLIRTETLEKNREIDSGVSAMTQDLITADHLVSRDRFYLPWNFCFRGRVYPIPHFSYHREDHIKALFMMADRLAIDDTAAMWMRIDLANLGDFDRVSKATLEDREQWAIDNEEMIYQCGTDFRASFGYWSKADKPFQFLLACSEYSKWLDDPSYLSGKPISFDGTNSCVQHYAAAALDEDDGELVNLTPSPLPSDVYQKVASKVTDRLQAYAVQPPITGQALDTWEKKEAKRVERINKERSRGTRANKPLARRNYSDFWDSRKKLATNWLGFGITRTRVKRNTMTYGYSSIAFGFAKQLMDDLMVPLQREVLRGRLSAHPFGDKESQEAHASYLANVNYPVISETIPSAQKGMTFIRSLARCLAHENKHFTWKTPLGFPVEQHYEAMTTKKIKIYLFDRVLAATVRSQVNLKVPEKDSNGGTRVDKKKAQDSAAPNVIHSWDANHLLSTILAAEKLGITSHMVIHDSFATVPMESNLLYAIIRAEFVNQYNVTCMYTDLLNQVAQQLDNPNDPKLPTVPTKGNLCLCGVMDSPYCFS